VIGVGFTPVGRVAGERTVAFVMANSSIIELLPEEQGLGPTTRIARVGANPAYDDDIIRFELRPNPRYLTSLAQYPDDPTRMPSVRAVILRGALDDELFLVGKYIKPSLRFEVYTVEHSQLLAGGEVDPSFDHFGLAWYLGHLEASENGVLSANIRAILLDQFFGFDAGVRLAPTGTFHIGLWFGDPADVAQGGFDVHRAPSMDREQRGGPLALISVPVDATGLGPLCTHPSTWVSLANCFP
jgi:hypothetical protein